MKKSKSLKKRRDIIPNKEFGEAMKYLNEGYHQRYSLSIDGLKKKKPKKK